MKLKVKWNKRILSFMLAMLLPFSSIVSPLLVGNLWYEPKRYAPVYSLPDTQFFRGEHLLLQDIYAKHLYLPAL